MKINDTLITQLRTFSLKKGRGQPRPFIYPLREWAICLLVTFVVAVALFGYAGVDFKDQLNEGNAPLLTEERLPRYHEEDAESIIRYYEGRTRTFLGTMRKMPKASFVITKDARAPLIRFEIAESRMRLLWR